MTSPTLPPAGVHNRSQNQSNITAIRLRRSTRKATWTSPHSHQARLPLSLIVNRRAKGALTQFWCSMGSVGANEPGFKEVELRTAVHLAFDELEFGDLPFSLAV